MSLHATDIGPIEMLRTGEGRDTLLFLHAAASGPRALYKLASALAAAGSGRQAALLALHGYGATNVQNAQPDDPFGAHLRAVQWAFDAIGSKIATERGRRIVFGHSMGGLMAVLAALDGMAADALVLFEPIVLGCLDMSDPDDAAARHWDGDRVAKLQAGVASGDPESGVRAFIEAFNEVSWSDLPASLRADLVSKAAQLAAETRQAPHVALEKRRLAALPMPVLILQGSTSPPVTQRMTLRLAEAIPHAERVVIEGAGHMGPALSPGLVAAAIGPFLDRLPR